MMKPDVQSPVPAAPRGKPGSAGGYVDMAGHAQLRQSIVAFLDILGFSQSIRATAEQGHAQLLVDRIVAAINDSREYVRQDLASEFASNPNCWGLKFFSDNLVVGYPFEGNEISPARAAWFVIRCAQRYQLRMTMNGFFLRGALSQGPLCLTDDLIFGSALLECYQLETKASIVPRVILTEPLRQMCAASLREQTEQVPPRASQSLCRDIDGWWFLSYLEAAAGVEGIDWGLVERHKQAVLQSLSHLTRHDVLPKYGWACRYHNMFCHWNREAAGYSDRYRIERIDESSAIGRLCDISE